MRAGCMTFNSTNLGDNAHLVLSQFTGTVLIPTPAGDEYTLAATAQDCCADCAKTTDVGLLQNAQDLDNSTYDQLVAKSWFSGCNLWEW